MILPNLLIVGAAKSGTTSLHNYLIQHPDVFMSKHKEPHFLINNEIGLSRIPKGINKINDYSNLFLNSENYQYRGESSAMYLQFPEIAIKNIKKYLDKHVKIIIMLRNPVDRAFSGYQHVKRYNIDEDLDFKNAIDQCEDRYIKNKNVRIGISHSQMELFVENWKKDLVDKFGENNVIVTDVGPALGVHAGPKVMCFAIQTLSDNLDNE